MRPILLATDGSPTAIGAASEAIELAHDLDTEIVIVAVNHVAPLTRPSVGLATVLRETAASIRSAGVACETIEATGSIADRICVLARERDARAIVVGAHGRSRIGRAVHGSVSDGVLHTAPCPVLLVSGAPERAATFHPAAARRPAVPKEAS